MENTDIFHFVFQQLLSHSNSLSNCYVHVSQAQIQCKAFLEAEGNQDTKREKRGGIQGNDVKVFYTVDTIQVSLHLTVCVYFQFCTETTVLYPNSLQPRSGLINISLFIVPLLCTSYRNKVWNLGHLKCAYVEVPQREKAKRQTEISNFQ